MKRRGIWTTLTAAAATVPVAMALPLDAVKIAEHGSSLGHGNNDTAALPHFAFGVPSAYAASGGEGGEGGEAGYASKKKKNAAKPKPHKEGGEGGEKGHNPAAKAPAEGGEGGEAGQSAHPSQGGEGGEGGEGGVNAATAADDPVAYLTGLDVMAAHFHAGLAAYLAGEKSEGAMMFAHAISEAYVDMEPAFKKLGVAPFEAALQDAMKLGNHKASDDTVKASVQKALDAISAAGAKAPPSPAGAEKTEAKVFLDMLNRSALQLMAASKGTGDSDAYLDGFGFLAAAKARSGAALKALDAVGPDAGARAREAIAALEKGYPAIIKPKQPAIEASAAMGAVSNAMLAAGSL